ncbi:hypothetical protein ACFL2S_10610, partial [Thermodesulfobacteriota bacterium]
MDKVMAALIQKKEWERPSVDLELLDERLAIQEECKATLKEYRWSDLGNAERLVDAHGHNLRYCHPFRKWLIWDEKRWANDNTGEIKRKCKSVIRNMYSEAGKEID